MIFNIKKEISVLLILFFKILLIYVLAIFVFSNSPYAKGLNFENNPIDLNIEEGMIAYDFAFKFINNSDKDIKIVSIKSSCGCTIIKHNNATYAPNQGGEIKGTFNIGDRKGLNEKSIVVFTDDVSNPRIKLLLRINIIDPVNLSPRLLFWTVGEKLNAKIATMTLKTKKLKFDKIEYDSKIFECETMHNDNKFYISVTPTSTKNPVKSMLKITLSNFSLKKVFYIHALIK